MTRGETQKPNANITLGAGFGAREGWPTSDGDAQHLGERRVAQGRLAQPVGPQHVHALGHRDPLDLVRRRAFDGQPVGRQIP